MARPAEPVDRAHRSAPVPVLPSALLAALGSALEARSMDGDR